MPTTSEFKTTMTPEELFELHPLPWTHNLLMIRDANGRQVIHTGGSYNEHNRVYEASYLSGLNALFVDAVNTRAPVVADPDAALGVTPEVAAKLLKVLDALVNNDVTEAYHWLYKIADADMTSTTPWAKLEALAAAPVSPTVSKCKLCGHDEGVEDDGRCKHWYSTPNSERTPLTFGSIRCLCRCEFPSSEGETRKKN